MDPAHPPLLPRAQGPLRPSARAAAPQADRELLLRMAAGDEAALGELYDRWSLLLHSLLWRLLRNEEDVEETFWQAWRQAGRYQEGRGSVSTWLTMMARSRALDRVRSRSGVREESVDDLPETGGEEAWTPAAESPLSSAEAEERREIVRRAVDRLPPEQRQTVELAFFGGLSQSEIAERLDQPLGTVKTAPGWRCRS